MNLLLEKATARDARAIKPIVDAAYSKYVERIGRLPAPMLVDYQMLVETQDVYVLRIDGTIVGSVLLARDGDSINVGNLVVDPSAQGRGYGKLLLRFAEDAARDAGLASVSLFTNEKMHENIALYTKIGFVEIDRRTEEGFNRVYFRKQIA